MIFIPLLPGAVQRILPALILSSDARRMTPITNLRKMRSSGFTRKVLKIGIMGREREIDLGEINGGG
jgi:hypothetical protein